MRHHTTSCNRERKRIGSGWRKTSFVRRRCGRETRWQERKRKAGGSRKRKRKASGRRKRKGFPLQSSHCFIDTCFINKLDLSLYRIRSIRLQLLNGSLRSWITHAVDLRIRYSTGDISVVTFLVTQLDSPVVLVFGYTWFYRYNPLIDWYKGQILSFQTPLQVSKPTPIGLQLPDLWPNESEPIQPQSIPTGPPLPEPRPTNSLPPWPESPSSPVTPEVPKVEQPKPSISFIKAAAYA